MKKVENTKHIEAGDAKKYQKNLNHAIEELQALNLEVEVSHSMCRAVTGIGYMYWATVIGRKE